MKRLSLEELKTQNSKLIVNLDAIKGGDADGCHVESSYKPAPDVIYNDKGPTGNK